ncbi:PPOX class probable F420-dependent enzyme [Okibacterium sp. HSC-33S16]|uniref:PPOX class F420-dependent oxidoreductase n=1 Tax=Okibacterium sp. HSC-33S16 TaxID=2910965 RepID=UPI0020A0E402|nr:PPOX class F420-dependent oxidoreductase [Okibacterium sp. HSC-33S16]MCP2030806.1 PPOX class probable F420-dependent enzyme [Okibacterium sp. HSC-33S16]
MSLTAFSAEPYALLTTFRASGEPVGTPVWVVEGLGGLLVTTSGASGKVKRIRRNQAVTLTPCDVQGSIAEGARTLVGRASVHEDAESRVVIDAALERKYGLRYKAIKAAGKLRRSASESVVVRIVPEVLAG